MQKSQPKKISLATASGSGFTISQLLGNIESVFRQLANMLFILATVVFLWGIIQYVIAGGDEKKIETAKNYIIWGIVGLFVMLTMWGLTRSICSMLFDASRCGS